MVRSPVPIAADLVMKLQHAISLLVSPTGGPEPTMAAPVALGGDATATLR